MSGNLDKISDEQVNGERKGITFLDYVAVLVKWRRFIIVNFIIVTVIAIIVSLLLPKWYRATASVLPPKDQGLLNLLGSTNSVLRGLSSLSRLGTMGQSSNAYNYFAILKSRSMMEDVVRRFDLISVYDVSDSSTEKAVKELRNNTSFESQDDDNITIEVYDKDPQRAADIANYFVSSLNSKSIELGTQEARGNREFIEKRLELTKSNLAHAEDTLKNFQERSGMMISPEQTSSVTAVAELYAMKAKKEVEVAILERTATKDNEILQQYKIELNEIDKKISKIPQAGLATIRLYREVITHQKILEFLMPLYEQAKINEQKDVPVLLVLDYAVRPERKVKPQRVLIVFLTSTLSLFMFILLAFLLHGFARQEEKVGPLGNALPVYARRVAARYKVHLT